MCTEIISKFTFGQIGFKPKYNPLLGIIIFFIRLSTMDSAVAARIRSTPLNLQPWQNGIQSLSIKSGSLCSFLCATRPVVRSLAALYELPVVSTLHHSLSTWENGKCQKHLNTRSTILCKSETVKFFDHFHFGACIYLFMRLIVCINFIE